MLPGGKLKVTSYAARHNPSPERVRRIKGIRYRGVKDLLEEILRKIENLNEFFPKKKKRIRDFHFQIAELNDRMNPLPKPPDVLQSTQVPDDLKLGTVYDRNSNRYKNRDPRIPEREALRLFAKVAMGYFNQTNTNHAGKYCLVDIINTVKQVGGVPSKYFMTFTAATIDRLEDAKTFKAEVHVCYGFEVESVYIGDSWSFEHEAISN